MVFKHNNQPFDNDHSYQLAFDHKREVDCGGQVASSAEFSSYMHTVDKLPVSDGERGYIFSLSEGGIRPGGNLKIENTTAVTPNDNSGSAPGNSPSFSWAISVNGGTVRADHSKRPLSDDHSYQAASKRSRQVDGDICPGSSTYEGPPHSITASEVCIRKDVAVPVESAGNHHSRNLSFPLTSNMSEEDMKLEPPARLSVFPGYYEVYHRTAGCNQLEETPSPVFDYPPRKLVAIGPNHQAIVPEWRPKCLENLENSDTCDASTSSMHLPIDENHSDKWIGTCVVPMPDSSLLASETQDGSCHISCHCSDEGSIRCVRQHVMEAREKLRRSLGQDQFVELGFDDMGEVAALSWTEEEEQLFQEIVLSNPASLGKNFWDVLPRAFPFRNSKEFISYYFNVFMLRKRADQNRLDPLNVDSDNDEWQDSDDGEFAVEEEEDDYDDSGVESPVVGDGVPQNNGRHGEIDIHEAEDEDDCDIEGLYTVSDRCIDSNKSKYGFDAPAVGINLRDGVGEDQDVQDDSCTSYEGHQNRVGSSAAGHYDAFEGMRNSLVKDDHENLHIEFRNSDMSSMADHDFIVGHCDPKPWENCYLRRIEKDVDFLPTCNVIEEVFGKDFWENDTRESHGVS